MRRLRIVVLGLSLSSSWGNGHATTFRSLLKAFSARGHEIVFCERDVPWYAAHRDLTDPDFCGLEFYSNVEELERFKDLVSTADAVIVGSYVPEGTAIGLWAQRTAKGVVAFYDIDTPVTLSKLERGEWDYIAPHLIPGYDVYFSFTGGPTLKLLMGQYHSPDARALYCSVDPEAYPTLDLPKTWDLSYLGTYSQDRQPTLELLLIEPARLAPHLRFVVAGAQYPSNINWPKNVERIEHVPPSEHPAFYARSRFTLNVTRADMVRAGFSPSVRLFEAAACRTPIISDSWDGIETLFVPGEEILLLQDTEEVTDLLTSSSRDLENALGHGVHRRIMAEHTAAHRAMSLEAGLIGAMKRRQRREEHRLAAEAGA